MLGADGVEDSRSAIHRGVIDALRRARAGQLMQPSPRATAAADNGPLSMTPKLADLARSPELTQGAIQGALPPAGNSVMKLGVPKLSELASRLPFSLAAHTEAHTARKAGGTGGEGGDGHVAKSGGTASGRVASSHDALLGSEARSEARSEAPPRPTASAARAQARERGSRSEAAGSRFAAGPVDGPAGALAGALAGELPSAPSREELRHSAFSFTRLQEAMRLGLGGAISPEQDVVDSSAVPSARMPPTGHAMGHAGSQVGLLEEKQQEEARSTAGDEDEPSRGPEGNQDRVLLPPAPPELPLPQKLCGSSRAPSCVSAGSYAPPPPPPPPPSLGYGSSRSGLLGQLQGGVKLRSSGERHPSQSAASGPSQPQSLTAQLAGAMAQRRSSIAAAEERDKDDDDDDW